MFKTIVSTIDPWFACPLILSPQRFIKRVLKICIWSSDAIGWLSGIKRSSAIADAPHNQHTEQNVRILPPKALQSPFSCCTDINGHNLSLDLSGQLEDGTFTGSTAIMIGTLAACHRMFASSTRPAYTNSPSALQPP